MREHRSASGEAEAARPVVVLLFCGAIAALDGADSQAVAIAAPLIARDLAIGPALLGLIFSASLLGAAIGAGIAGQLADRFGARRILILSTLLFGALQLATAFGRDFASLLALRFLAGIGLGGATPCFLSLAAAHAAPAIRGRILGLIWACFPLGALVGGSINGWLVQHWSWREVFVLGGVLPLIVAPALAYAVHDPASTNTPLAAPRPRSILLADSRLRARLLLLCLIFFGAFGTLAGIVVWMPSILAGQGFPPGDGGAVLSWHAMGALASIAGGGWLLERLGVRLLPVSLLASALLLALLGLRIADFHSVAAFMLLLGITLGLPASAGIALAGLTFPADRRSACLGFAMAAGRIGQMILPYLMGLGLGAGLSARLILQLCAGLPLVAALAATMLTLLLASPDGLGSGLSEERR